MLSRRDALRGGTAVATCAAVSTAAGAIDAVVAKESEPLLEMERQWIARRDHYRTCPDESDEARDPLLDCLIEMEVEIHRTPATTPAGIAVKLRMWAQATRSVLGERVSPRHASAPISGTNWAASRAMPATAMCPCRPWW